MPDTGLKTDFRAKVNNKLSDIGVKNHLKQRIVQSMTAVVESFAGAVQVFGKDAHPGNWLAADRGEIAALDMEDKGVVPLEIDLVNLLEFDSFGLKRRQREELKERIIGVYLEYYGRYLECSGEKMPFSRLRYLNAVIQRMLCLYCFWSCRGRDTAGIRRNFVLDNALYAIGEISHRFKDYFSSHHRDYNGLETALNRLKFPG
ncbi:MAG: hypothetical protein KAW12_05535 [Candidatus Aminicenantes bacterium]|nr:hypothetical protein [Candidatus Aminicenantes bacterium]